MRTPAAATRILLAAWLCVLTGGCAIVDWEQRRWIFQPVKHAWEPGLEAAQGMQDNWIDFVSAHPEHSGESVRLHALWLPQGDPAAPVVLFLHGVRWDVRASAPRMRLLHSHGFSVLGLDYRGFGRSSEAMPSESLVAEDAYAAWDWLARNFPESRRFVYGHSLGAAVAVRLAQEVDDESGLIIEGGFTSTLDLLRSTRWGWLPVAALITQHFDAGSRIGTVGSPVLVIHGSEDTMVAPRLGCELYKRAGEPKRFLLVDGAVHENTGEVGHAHIRAALSSLFGLSQGTAGAGQRLWRQP